MAKPNDIGSEQEGTFLVRISASDANTYVMSHYIAPALTERFDFSALTPWVSCVFISIGEMELVCLSLPLVVWVSFALLAYLFRFLFVFSFIAAFNIVFTARKEQRKRIQVAVTSRYLCC